MPQRPSLSKFAILSIRIIESLIIISVATGLNVFQAFVLDPFSFLQTAYKYVLNAGNVFWVGFLVIVLYATNFDKAVLDWVKQNAT